MSIKTIVNLTSNNIFSLIYHNFFEYPLTRLELPAKGLISSRILRKKNSLKKIQIARKVSRLLKKIPFIKMIAITGSLSMFNAKDSSDIDLMVVTRKERLWTTRLLSILLLTLCGIKMRRWGDKNEKNKICINIWIDESALTWVKNDRNFYTAHEIAQIIPLFDRENVYQKFLNKNSWLKEYWPNSVKIEKIKKYRKYKKLNVVEKVIEKLSFNFQKFYMKKKRTREVVNSKKAFFHPIDRSKDINSYLTTYFR